MKYLSLFSGIGGFEVGIKQSNIKAECVGFSEIDKYAKGIYRLHYPDHADLGDATRIRTEDLPNFSVLIGGFPCQSFSVAGKRKGFDDTRGTLFYEIARILKDKRPRYFLLENVRGLVYHDKGKTLQTILEILSSMDYWVEMRIFNSKNYGVPQNRERMFIIGCLRDGGRRKVFPFFRTATKDNELEIKKINKSNSQGNRVYNTDGLATCLSANGGGQGAKTGLYAVPVVTPERVNKRQNGRRFKENNDPMFTLTACDRHGVLVNKCYGSTQKNRAETDGTYSPTLTASMGKGGGHVPMVGLENEEYRIRRLTPIECERLQAFPDNWTKYGIIDNEKKKISDAQRYKCLGNAVTTKVIKFIFNAIFT